MAFTQHSYPLNWTGCFPAVNFLIWLVGIGTLLAGAIGVSNIMMVTVKERTTEIGIRRAIGATPKMILSQIISESILLTLVAGMSGILFGVAILQMLEVGSTTNTNAWRTGRVAASLRNDNTRNRSFLFLYR